MTVAEVIAMLEADGWKRLRGSEFIYVKDDKAACLMPLANDECDYEIEPLMEVE